MLKELIYRVKKLHHLVSTWLLGALPANLYYGFPSRKLKVIIFTGTDGKTTSSTLTYKVLLQANKKVGLISTVAAYIGDKQLDTGFHITTPGPWELQKLLAEFVKQQYEYVVIETTSHGIYQFRTWGIRPLIGGLTNISHNEALDYHVTYKNYVDAKCQKLKQADSIWINKQDESFPLVTELLPKNKTHAYTALQNIPESTKKEIVDRFPQEYNQANATLVYQVTKELGIEEHDFNTAIKNFETVPGRMQEVKNAQGYRVIVDFAHTPNALHQALSSLRQTLPANKKLIAIFGCAGLRDPGKRAPMAKFATEIADFAIFTAEDPRTEDIWTIIRQMKEQLTEHHDKMISIPDREQAIQYAFSTLAKKGDTVAIFGKGHEHSLAYGSTEYSWNDVAAVQKILGEL